MYKHAIISKCGNYRYTLSRIWDVTKPRVLFLMLNPSTADSIVDDPTIRRCINFAKSWGYGGIYVGNLFAYRATNPKVLFAVKNPVGRNNLEYLKLLLQNSQIVVCAWGNATIVKKLKSESIEFIAKIQNKMCLELSKDGVPKHPLYLKSDLKPIKF